MDLDRETQRLLDDAACLDAAPSKARSRLRQRLLSGVSAGTISTSAIIAKGATLGASGATTVAATSTLSHLVIGTVLVGFSAGAVVIGPTLLSQVVHPTHPTSVIQKPSAVAVEMGGSAAPTTAPEASSSNVAPEVETAKPIPAPMVIATSPNPIVASSIARETAMLGDVQRELKSGRPQLALEKLNAYLDEFPSGRLNEEAIASRVVALCALGRISEGQRWAVEFERRAPNSPLLSRVHLACAKDVATTKVVPELGNKSTE
jgi:hypothetical protein